MDKKLDHPVGQRVDDFPRRSPMSSMALSPNTRYARTRSTRVPETRTPVVLTRRGRIVLTAVFALAVMVALVAFSAHSAASDHAGTPVQTRTIEVGEGDTLWGIAASVAGPGQVRDMIQQIEDLNALPGPSIQVGQELAVPVG